MTTVQASRLGWYARRMARMSPAEVVWRARDQALQAVWSRRQVSREQVAVVAPARPGGRTFTAVLPVRTAARVPDDAKKAVLAAADQLLSGGWEVLGVARTDLVQPDWFYDPVTGRRAPADRYAFRINHRSEHLTDGLKDALPHVHVKIHAYPPRESIRRKNQIPLLRRAFPQPRNIFLQQKSLAN